MATDKAEKKAEVSAAPASDAPPKPTKEAMLAELLALYSRNMEAGAPRNLDELKLIQELVAAK